ncbi:MAG: precorrin-8X methylmutase [Rhodospirillaceae bacterium]|nr:precorrin-8X methylmutase [Rhodospirillaceae bacterium]|tara:strand:+ start:251 stop:898 length:648 start_codon:yes stop_codon:yes gene_type:complete
MKIKYEKNPDTIYKQSFSIVREETDFSQFNEKEAILATRIVHACGIPEVASNLRFSDGAIDAGIAALSEGPNVICDCNMVKAGISISTKLIQCKVQCFLEHPTVLSIAKAEKTTRSAAQVEVWKDFLSGSIVVIGNAPTALFRLLEEIQEGAAKPAIVIGFPVGFVGASESKKLLNELRPLVPHATILGRLGGSAMAAAAFNALVQLADRSINYE